jgi:hypothetical protein
MDRREESETAEPQNDSLREERWGHPSERTSVAVSERAQQNDWNRLVKARFDFHMEGLPSLVHEGPLRHW